MNKSTGKDQFFINRSFDIPVEAMFEIWTNPKQLSQWLPPTGFKMNFIKSEIKTGGSAFYCMFNESGAKMYGRTQYLELRHPDRVVYTQQFCDENEKITRHPMSPTWPETMLTTVTLTKEGPKRTRVTITWEPHNNPNQQELDTFSNAKSSMAQGWTGSFDKLEEYIVEFIK